MNKHRDKSDFEINELVSFNLDYIHTKSFDPCNNPADAMPIIIENGISLINDSGKLFAAAPGCGVEGYLGDELCGYGSRNYSENDNICRAAMEVFLMMKDAEK